MRSSPGALTCGATIVLLIGASGCGRGADRALEIVAPALETARVRFAAYPYSPVGDFAAKRGPEFPFIDANDDGKYDSAVEAAGHCDRQEGRCWLDRSRITIIRTTTDCPGTSGLMIMGKVYDRSGRQLHSTLCDETGVCSGERKQAFQDLDTVEAMWIAEAPDMAPVRALALRAGPEVLRYEGVTTPPPLQVLDSRVEESGDLQAFVTTDLTIDMAALWLMRGENLQWSSAGRATTFQAKGNELVAILPRVALDACGDGCEIVLSVAHVWRDDQVFAVSEVRQKIR